MVRKSRSIAFQRCQITFHTPLGWDQMFKHKRIQLPLLEWHQNQYVRVQLPVMAWIVTNRNMWTATWVPFCPTAYLKAYIQKTKTFADSAFSLRKKLQKKWVNLAKLHACWTSTIWMCFYQGITEHNRDKLGNVNSTHSKNLMGFAFSV